MPASENKRSRPEFLIWLNSLPSVNATRFKPGQPAHNRSERHQVPCATCQTPILKTQHQINRSKKHFCSRECCAEGKMGSRTGLALKLYQSGEKIRDIAQKLGTTIGTVTGLIYRSKLRTKFGNRRGFGREAIKSILPKHCELCGYSRIVETAHIVPVRNGGKYSMDNCFSLCPNCHHLFDHDLLTPNEKSKLKEIHASRLHGSPSSLYAAMRP